MNSTYGPLSLETPSIKSRLSSFRIIPSHRLIRYLTHSALNAGIGTSMGESQETILLCQYELARRLSCLDDLTREIDQPFQKEG